MKLIGLKFAAAALALVMVTGCGSDDGTTSGTGGTGGSSTPTIEEVGGLYAEAMCAWFLKCQGPMISAFVGDEATCKSMFTANFQDKELPRLKAAIAANTLTYDGTKVAACLNTLKAGTCAMNPDNNADCDSVFTGTVAQDGACNIDQECAGSATCVTDGQTCPGKCAKLGAEGEPCGVGCASGLYCAEDKCAPQLDDGAECSSSSACKAGNCILSDNAGGDDKGKCGVASFTGDKAENEACSLQTGVFCQEGLSCAAKSFSAAGPEMVCLKQVKAGEACYMAMPSQCEPNYMCDADPGNSKFEGKCIPMPKEGETCDPEQDSMACVPGLVCEESTSKCSSVKRLGEACSDDELCASGHCKDGTCQTEACN